MGSAGVVLDAYGVREFLEDADRARSYAAEGDAIVNSALTWASEEGFAEVMEGLEIDMSSAAEWRARFVTRAIRALLPKSAG